MVLSLATAAASTFLAQPAPTPTPTAMPQPGAAKVEGVPPESPAAGNPPVKAEVTVVGRGAEMIGIASSATQATVGADELAERPVQRAGVVLEAVPGVIITQRSAS